MRLVDCIVDCFIDYTVDNVKNIQKIYQSIFTSCTCTHPNASVCYRGFYRIDVYIVTTQVHILASNRIQIQIHSRS